MQLSRIFWSRSLAAYWLASARTRFIRSIDVPITTAIASIPARSTASSTVGMENAASQGGTKKKLNVADATTAAVMAGPRPHRIATIRAERRNGTVVVIGVLTPP